MLNVAAALLIGLIVPFFVARGWNALRRAYYKRFTRLSPPGIPTYRVLGLHLSKKEEQARAAVAELVSESHDDAMRLQNAYHLLMATAASALLVAFVSMAAELTLGDSSVSQVQCAGVLDVTCLLVTLICFLKSASLSDAWIVARARAELLRQWYLIDELLLGGTSKGDLTTRFFQIEARTRALTTQDTPQLTEKVEDFWQSRRIEICAAVSTVSLSASRIGSYLARRPLRQMRWFYAARCRLEHQTRVRTTSLSWLFGVTLLLSIAKLLLAFHMIELHWISIAERLLSFAVLFSIGASSALTALYLGQNTRSLVHRYAIQERHIRDWLTNLSSQLKMFDQEVDDVTLNKFKMQFVESVIEFEDLMIGELNDWIEITTHDVFELAPS